MIVWFHEGEYGANFIAIHTIAQWCRFGPSADTSADSSDADIANIKLEQENRSGQSDDDGVTIPTHIYHPRSALKKSLQLWLHEFKKIKSMWGPITRPHTSSAPPVSVAYPTPATTSNLDNGANISTSDDAIPTSSSAPLMTTESGNEVIDIDYFLPSLLDQHEQLLIKFLISF